MRARTNTLSTRVAEAATRRPVAKILRVAALAGLMGLSLRIAADS